MPTIETRSSAYADLGDAWLRAQTLRLRQKHLQLGRHFRLDLDALLARAAHAARAGRSTATQIGRGISPSERIRRATIEAIEHCARLEAN